MTDSLTGSVLREQAPSSEQHRRRCIHCISSHSPPDAGQLRWEENERTEEKILPRKGSAAAGEAVSLLAAVSAYIRHAINVGRSFNMGRAEVVATEEPPEVEQRS